MQNVGWKETIRKQAYLIVDDITQWHRATFGNANITKHKILDAWRKKYLKLLNKKNVKHYWGFDNNKSNNMNQLH